MNQSLPLEEHTVDVCIIGGGMAGLIAAVSAARRGCSVMLVHDRAVLGGNASSEVRMWICGAHGRDKKESGILEEIQLTNLHRNPDGNYSVWDSVLYEYGKMTRGLTTLMNTSCNNAKMEDGHLVSVDAWQMTTQTWHRISAKYFIDCSGDSILAPLSGANFRQGREARDEFNESLAPVRTDRKTMGNTILLQLEETSTEQSFKPPAWAYTFDDNSTLPSRLGDGFGHNFWWLELGGLNDTITEAEAINEDLVKAAWGVWDYMKNRGPQAQKLKNWRLSWLGSLPGKRENRRYLAPHVLTQNDVEAGGKFEDIVAYGGWSMDDHHPAGLYYPGNATLFHKAPSPYGIPFSSLHSRNVPNLFCAGRNISATHSALSSTRVMGTCSLLGQAVGTAAALCNSKSVMPGDISGALLKDLQKHLMEDDCWLPGLAKPNQPLMEEAKITSSTGGDVTALMNGHERKVGDELNVWESTRGSVLTLNWEAPRHVECLRLVFDSDLSSHKRMPCRYKLESANLKLPKVLVRAFRVEAQIDDGTWETVFSETDNRRRLVVIPIQRETRALRFIGESNWGNTETIRVFSIEARQETMPHSVDPPRGISWVDATSLIDPKDLAEPDHGLEAHARGSTRFSA
ncbi:FAD-dependent oxidoreductase [Rubellicoccus peritrichatus]|uniref:FAD-dependent oxidoreductase n=1 Tax=Rubellicoccus peritrichatus TaxID=3080537 RepID=A0AAQ3LCT7_9BACT|nr:FAD-dependent oxidoreductase [Puniceicoccus sp. CR14]WOO41530.1 FAD-dependent oxidoreductase [Puniceicoccus sp. CR14]